MRGEVLGAERRRRWSDDAKLEIVSSVGIQVEIGSGQRSKPYASLS